MTRIVAGAAKGRRLAVPPAGTRPTSDRAREALFNSLAGLVDLPGARVLDLFAGTGAVGLEALSRGASLAVLVESHRAAFATLRRNAEAVGLPGARPLHRCVAAYLDTPPDEPFHLAFADPPYAYGDNQLAAVLASLTADGWLVEGGIVVVERSARGDAPAWPDEMEAIKHKRYGEGVLWYGRRR